MANSKGWVMQGRYCNTIWLALCLQINGIVAHTWTAIGIHCHYTGAGFFEAANMSHGFWFQQVFKEDTRDNRNRECCKTVPDKVLGTYNLCLCKDSKENNIFNCIATSSSEYSCYSGASLTVCHKFSGWNWLWLACNLCWTCEH